MGLQVVIYRNYWNISTTFTLVKNNSFSMKSKVNSLVILLFLLLNYHSQAQLTPFYCDVIVDGQLLSRPFEGGVQSPILQEADLNNDGIRDLIYFDRAGSVLLTYIRSLNNGQSTLTLERSYAQYIPPFTGWVLVNDYDQDGIADLFTWSFQAKPGFIVYRGKYQNDTLMFDRFKVSGTTDDVFLFNLPSGGKSQIYISSDDVPSFYDVDADGDLDLVTFDPGGGYVQLYKNTSQEQGFGSDSLIFYLADLCWGKFYESGLTTKVNLSNDPSKCAETLWEIEMRGDELRHVGSTTLVLDMNGDSLPDILLGDISFSNVVLLTNGGNLNNAWMIDQDTLWPSFDHSVHIPTFPALYQIDYDLDGYKDILVAPNRLVGALDTQNIWMYRNEGTNELPDYRLSEKGIFSKDMLDVGTSSHPAFIDIDGDGLLDMLIGNFGYYDSINNFTPSINYFRNSGTLTQPAFDLVDRDYLQFSKFGINFQFSFVPAVGDLDGDGDLDLVVGQSQGNMYYVQNLAGIGAPPVFATPVANAFGIVSGSFCTPQIVDLNHDGLGDLLIGENQGKLRYYQNIGTIGQPAFNPNVNQLPNVDFVGQIDVRKLTFSPQGKSVPMLYQTSNGFEILVGSNFGEVKRYSFDVNNLNTKFQLLDSNYTGYLDGLESSPVLVDIDNDGLKELFVGNIRGGLTAYRTPIANITSTNNPIIDPESFSTIYSPQEKLIYIRKNLDSPILSVQLTLVNSIGQIVHAGVFKENEIMLSTQGMSHGLYCLRIHSDGAMAAFKVIIY